MEEKNFETPEQMERVESDAADALTSSSVKLTVDIKPKNKLHVLLMKWRLKPKEKDFYIGFLTVRNVIRISKITNKYSVDFTDMLNLEKEVMGWMADNGEALVKIAAIVLHNGENEPPKSLIKFVENNFTASQMFLAITLAVNRINVSTFTITIASSHGVNVMKNTARRMEASQK